MISKELIITINTKMFLTLYHFGLKYRTTLEMSKTDGTALGWINRQKKVLELKKDLDRREGLNVSRQAEIDTINTENEKVYAELRSAQNQVEQNQNLINVKKNELAALEVSINKISLDDPRKTQLEKLQADKIANITKLRVKFLL